MHRNRLFSVGLALMLAFSALSHVGAQEPFDIPLRINFGGPEVVDAAGNTWLGDPGAGLDALGIRPDDTGGPNVLEAWCAPDPFLLPELGFPEDDPVIQAFQSIRWDPVAVGADFLLEIPVPNGTYELNFFFCESCCLQRHFKIQIQGEIVEEDVSAALYADGLTQQVGRLSYGSAFVDDGVLRIGLLGCPDCECPECVGGVVIDPNPTISALEIVPDSECDPEDFDLSLACAHDADLDRVTGTWEAVEGAENYRVLKNGAVLIPSLPDAARSFTDANPRSDGTDVEYAVLALDGGVEFGRCECLVRTFACPRALECVLDRETGEVDLSWEEGIGVEVAGFEVRRNGVLLDTLPVGVNDYTDTPDDRVVVYEVTPLTDVAGQCRTMSCELEINTVLFEVPFLVNTGGPAVVDSRGREWLGDEGVGLDANNIRPDDAGGANFIGGWCNPDPAFVDSLGFDSTHAGDMTIFRSIRWDDGNDASDYVFEIPIAEGEYNVELFFCESCCDHRHFKIDIQGERVYDDVHVGVYAEGVFHRPGRLTMLEVPVDADNLLTIALLPCPECACPTCGNRQMDINAILSGLAVTSADEVIPVCPGELACDVAGDGTVTASWEPPTAIDLEGYQIMKNGAELLTLGADAVSFSDDLAERVGVYEVRPISAEGETSNCHALSCTVLRDDLLFEIPLRINARPLVAGRSGARCGRARHPPR